MPRPTGDGKGRSHMSQHMEFWRAKQESARPGPHRPIELIVSPCLEPSFGLDRYPEAESWKAGTRQIHELEEDNASPADTENKGRGGFEGRLTGTSFGKQRRLKCFSLFGPFSDSVSRIQF
ncbi:uncharacterized protein PV06_05470 [Exophiala oligosperma]|uniref:Uncharacterized protein n=1 Tax=Exophiala oligosperma TaxID=215243 RepID=A0A0D2E232_9EURO|nr:uncharacterized protein PV06_05470 [Exophiala oligosperma]KIW41869.1 hypothetical protein PV06_05470 [Exophiala oligosperma]